MGAGSFKASPFRQIAYLVMNLLSAPWFRSAPYSSTNKIAMDAPVFEAEGFQAMIYSLTVSVRGGLA